MKHPLSFLLFCLILLSGCKSAEHYYQQGQSAAQAGNQDAAAQLYLQSLSKDAQFTPAKNEALLHLKNLAQNSFKLSEEATKSVQHVKAYKVLKAYEIFKAQLEAVSPTKSENKAFNAYKSLKQSAAVKELLAQSDRAKENSDVAVAMKQLQTIESCEPTKEQQKQVTSRQKALGKIVFDQQIAIMRKLFKMENYSGARKALDLAKVHATETEEQKLVTQLSVAIDQAEDEERAKMESQRIAYLPIFCPIADVSLDNLSELKKSLKHDGTKGFSNIPEEEVQKALRQMELHFRMPKKEDLPLLAKLLQADYLILTSYNRRDFLERAVEKTPAEVTNTQGQIIKAQDCQGLLLGTLKADLRIYSVRKNALSLRTNLSIALSESFQEWRTVTARKATELNLTKEQLALFSGKATTVVEMEKEGMKKLAEALVKRVETKLQ